MSAKAGVTRSRQWEIISWFLAVLTLLMSIFRFVVDDFFDGLLVAIAAFMVYQAVMLRRQRGERGGER